MYLYFPGMTESAWDSALWSQRAAPSVMWRSKLSPLPTWLRRCKRALWLQRLSGPMLEPSMVDRGAAAWISSLPVIPASRSAWLESVGAKMIPGTSGPKSGELLATFDRDLSFWRMCQDTFLSDSIPSSPTLPRSGSMQNGKLYPHPRWEPATSANGCGCWPTPKASEGEKGGPNARHGSGDQPLGSAAASWPTPRASMNENRSTKPTPTALAGKHGKTLAAEAAVWQTPASDSFRSRGGPRKTEMGLDQQARVWPTCRACSGKGSSGANRTEFYRAFPRAQVSANGGPTSSSDIPTSPRRLNPLFTEWLMGLPFGWTGCGLVAMESCQSWRQRHLPSLRAVLGSTLETAVNE